MTKLPSFLLLHLFPLFSILSREVNAVRIIEVSVPSKVQFGDSVTLTCVFDLEGQALYSLNWWRNNDQFYQFDPSEGKQQIIYETHGIDVDEWGSNLREVKLRNVTEATEGEFKCEVVADYPSYERDSAIASMEIFKIPSNAPEISLGRSRYKMGDHLKANCTAESFSDPPVIFWYLNGKKVNSKHIRKIYPRDHNHQDNQEHHRSNHHNDHHKKKRFKRHLAANDYVISHIYILLRKTEFALNGRVVLTCSAIYSEIFSRSTKVDVTRSEAPSIKPSLRVSSASGLASIGQLMLLLLVCFIQGA